MKGSVRKRGENWYYYFSITVDGKRKKHERKGGRTKKEAESALTKSLAEFEGTGKVFTPTEINVCDYFDFWRDNYVKLNLKPNSIITYQIIVDKHIKSYFKNYKLKALTPAILQDFINYKYSQGYKKSTLSEIYRILSGALKLAVHPYGYINDNPMRYIKMPKYNKTHLDKKSKKFISKEDYKKIINHFKEGTDFYVPLQIAYHTGLRSSEVSGLTWECIDLDKGIISVEKILLLIKANKLSFGTPKTVSSNRQIKIGDTLISVLRKHKKNQLVNKIKYGAHYKRYSLVDNNIIPSNHELDNEINFVSTKENGKIITKYVIRHLSTIINKKLNMDFTFHALRHTHATMLIEAGANMKDVQARLGHSNLAITMDTYSHVTDKMKSSTVDLFKNTIL